MKDKNTLLKQKQILVLNGSVVLWEPAKNGETLFGQSFIGCARKTDSSSRVVRSMEAIVSVEAPTSEQVTAYESAVKNHDLALENYYKNNSYTED